MTTKALANILTQPESERYTKAKQTIRMWMDDAFAVGTALTDVRDKKLYRQDYGTFDEFCRQEFNIERTYAHRLMEAAEIKLSPIGNKIENEAQARAIAAVPEDLREDVMKEAAKEGGTAKAITEAAKEFATAPKITVYATEAEAKAAGDKMEPAHVEHTVDTYGHIVPKDVLPIWERAITVGKELTNAASNLKCAIEAGHEDEDVVFATITNQSVADAKNLFTDLKRILPHTVCPTCHGRGRKSCRLCKSRGFVDEFTYTKAVSEKARKLHEAHGATKK